MYHVAKWSQDMRMIRHSATQIALGGPATIGVIASDQDSADDISTLMKQCWHDIFRFEKMASRFLQTSELTMINQRAGLWTDVSHEMYQLLETVQNYVTLTDGVFNPFLLPTLQRSGYLHSALDGHTEDSVPDFRGRIATTASQLELRDHQVHIPHATALDLGGIGKGYLADHIADALEAHGISSYWVDLSGDIAIRGRDEHGQPLEIAIDGRSETITALDTRRGVATSGTRQRKRQHLAAHHIIDPRTGQAAQSSLKQATIWADSATAADIYASCAIIVGSRAPKWLETRGVSEYYLTESHEREAIHA